MAEDDQGAIDTDSVTVTLDNAAAALPYSEGFESGIGAWAVYDPAGSQRWAQKSTAYAGTKSAGLGSNTGYDYDEHDSLCGIRLAISGTPPAGALPAPAARGQRREHVQDLHHHR